MRLNPVLGALCLVTACAHAPSPLVIHEPGPAVQVPVRVGCQPPPVLLASIALPPHLEFLPAANNPAATSCLAPAAETALQGLLWSLHQRLESWRVWAQSCQ